MWLKNILHTTYFYFKGEGKVTIYVHIWSCHINNCFISPACLHNFKLVKQVLPDGKTLLALGIRLGVAIEVRGRLFTLLRFMYIYSVIFNLTRVHLFWVSAF